MLSLGGTVGRVGRVGLVGLVGRAATQPWHIDCPIDSTDGEAHMNGFTYSRRIIRFPTYLAYPAHLTYPT
jgi:hypothetical protein